MHYAEVARPPPDNFGALFGLGRPKDQTKWQWEAPSIPQAPKQTSQLPSWLTEFEAPELVETLETGVEKEPDAISTLNQHLAALRQASSLQAVTELNSEFNKSFKQSIYLGQVSADVLALSLRDVPNYIRQRVKTAEQADDLCLKFMQTVWEGVTTSKVIKASEMGARSVQLLILQLQRLPLLKSAPLFSQVLDAINGDQKDHLKHEVNSSLEAVFGSIMGGPNAGQQSASSGLASIVSDGIVSVTFLERFVESLAQALSKYDTSKSVDHVRDLARISTSYLALSIHQHCISVSKQIRHGNTTIDPKWDSIRTMRTTWLKLVARMPFMTEALLADACRIMEAGDPHSEDLVRADLAISDLSEIFLEFHSRGEHSAEVQKAKASYEDAISNQGTKNAIVHLCRALELHSRNWRNFTKSFLCMLRGVRGPSLASYNCLRRLERDQLYLRPSILVDEIRQLSEAHLPEAISLVKSYIRRPIDALKAEDFPDLIVAMIRSSSCRPEEVWQLLGGERRWSETRISQARIELIRTMALEFSRAKHLPTRVALRNITKCYHYLSFHRVPIPVEISRAITEVGLERNVLEKGAINEDRLDWVLKIVSQAEGNRKAGILAQVMARRKKQELHRNRDILGYR